MSLSISDIIDIFFRKKESKKKVNEIFGIKVELKWLLEINFFKCKLMIFLEVGV